eukprot:131310-Rhodomonas_salina.1
MESLIRHDMTVATGAGVLRDVLRARSETERGGGGGGGGGKEKVCFRLCWHCFRLRCGSTSFCTALLVGCRGLVLLLLPGCTTRDESSTSGSVRGTERVYYGGTTTRYGSSTSMTTTRQLLGGSYCPPPLLCAPTYVLRAVAYWLGYGSTRLLLPVCGTPGNDASGARPVSYTHLRAHETEADL